MVGLVGSAPDVCASAVAPNEVPPSPLVRPRRMRRHFSEGCGKRQADREYRPSVGGVPLLPTEQTLCPTTAVGRLVETGRSGWGTAVSDPRESKSFGARSKGGGFGSPRYASNVPPDYGVGNRSASELGLICSCVVCGVLVCGCGGHQGYGGVVWYGLYV